MSPRAWRFLGILVLMLGPVACAHPRSVGPNESPGSVKDEKPGRAAADADANSVKAPRVAPRTHHHPAADTSGSVPIAMSPAGLLKAHAVDSIQEKLRSSGHLSSDRATGKLDEPTREALRGFQRDKGLPATGILDDVTVEKLGLRPRDVFRASSP